MRDYILVCTYTKNERRIVLAQDNESPRPYVVWEESNHIEEERYHSIFSFSTSNEAIEEFYKRMKVYKDWSMKEAGAEKRFCLF